MSAITKEIESLEARIARLKVAQEKEAAQKQAMAEAQDQIKEILANAGLTLEAYVRNNIKAVRRVVAKIDKEEAANPAPAKKPRKATKPTAKKRRRTKSKAKTTIKIPAGQYTNIPSEPETVFTVKEKGPRPKPVKAYAEEVGLEAFLAQCAVAE